MQGQASAVVVRSTANFERNLESIEQFLREAGAPQAFDALLAELLDTVLPNLERFPDLGRSFLARPIRSVNVETALAALRSKLRALLAADVATEPLQDVVREYILKDYLLLYARIGQTLYLLAIRHHRQLSFDLSGHWPS